MKKILLVLLLLMPIDGFSPGAAILREFGGRPFNLFMLILLIFSFFYNFKEWIDYRLKRSELVPIALIIFAVCLSSLFFLVKQVDSNSVFELGRSPISSYISQLLVFTSSLIFILYLRRFFQISREVFLRNVFILFLMVSFFHLVFFFLHALSISGVNIFIIKEFLDWIRPGVGVERPFGLMTEPSYWGAFVAYTWPVLFFCSPKGSVVGLVGRVTAVILIGTALSIGARTLFGILFIQVLMLVVTSRISKKSQLLLLLAAMAIGGIVLVTSTDIFAVSDNLSSAMRLGSTLMGVNVAREFGLIGIGVGQFHFYYRPEFAPDFLFLSQEATDILGGATAFRASTFNFYVRLVVEIGVLGLIGYGWLILKSAKNLVLLYEKNFRTGLLLSFVGALAFWLTQDSFLYSPALFFIALGLGMVGQKNAVSTASTGNAVALGQ